MSQERLNCLLLLHCHKARTDDLQLQAYLREFIETKEHRQNVLEGLINCWRLSYSRSYSLPHRIFCEIVCQESEAFHVQ